MPYFIDWPPFFISGLGFFMMCVVATLLIGIAPKIRRGIRAGERVDLSSYALVTLLSGAFLFFAVMSTEDGIRFMTPEELHLHIGATTVIAGGLALYILSFGAYALILSHWRRRKVHPPPQSAKC